MNFGAYSSLFLLSTIKFLFSPFAGPVAGLTFLETYISCVAGAILSATVFYFMSEYFMNRARMKIIHKREEAKRLGKDYAEKKKFTRGNKFIVQIKRRLGIYGVCLYAPLFLSVPIGTIISAKFYGKDKKSFPLIILGMFINGLITTSLAYFIF